MREDEPHMGLEQACDVERGKGREKAVPGRCRSRQCPAMMLAITPVATATSRKSPLSLRTYS